ncbi:dienelactone hydrolase family protein [Azohydromonas caseinilytica]|uniref:Prolyl oligopeptidase family serine peptidase n=1 Tax=Azohydromonas caseinilytica TaxID=2728836 RepID=A0A848F7G9_9BURK|nr:CocE/NonD family hydrolase [Azohydromonas caseinilytica]NML16057.1 prolyl oligopeptidase family serine peptidase [Azohydromonas caseinilytica]
MKITHRLLGTLALCWTLALLPGAGRAQASTAAPEASMNERVLMVPVDAQRNIRLQVTVLQPDGPGPFPLAVVNHGASGKQPPARMERHRHTFAAYYFLSRGYAVALPMLRGYAGSEGRLHPAGCNYESVALGNAADIQAVIDFMARDPTVDARRTVMAGQSFGGWNTLAFGSLGDPRVKALVSFAGGMNASSCPNSPAVLPRGAGRFGATTRVPSIWFYGENDSFFGPPLAQVMHERYTAAGGRAELVAFGPFMKDAHELLAFPQGLPIWAPRLDAFLHQLGLPGRIVHPEYLPQDFPPPSGYAAIDDVDAVPYLDDRGREHYRRFLARSAPRVYVLSRSGFAGAYYGGFDPVGRGLKECRLRARDCFVYAVDDHVAWSRPTPAPPASGFAAHDDVAAIPFINQAGRQGYLKYLSMRRPKAFAIAPDGAWSAAALGPDPLAMALEACGKAHQGCRLYAVDHSVVWAGQPEGEP